ncbi:outer membrane protein assembly factor BamD, partial [Pseudomonadota bacterium]
MVKVSKELHSANYYMRRSAYLSAANRAKYVIENYPQTPAVPDALAIMVRAYQQLGVQDLANNALEILKLNFPEHEGIDELSESPAS